MIATGRQSADGTVVPTIREPLGYSCPAQTCLTCVTRVHFNQFAPSFFRFVREFLKEGTPPCVIYRLGKHTARQPFDIQILYGNPPIAIHQPAARMVVKIRPLVLDLLM